jgi:hypothetical protein
MFPASATGASIAVWKRISGTWTSASSVVRWLSAAVDTAYGTDAQTGRMSVSDRSGLDADHRIG